jgi:hypothetical protein
MKMSDEVDLKRNARAPLGRRFWLWMGSGIFTLVLLAGLLIAAGALVLKDRPLTVPPWLQTRIEARIAEALPQARVTFGEMVLVLEDDWAPRIRLRDVVVKTPEGAEVLRLNEFKAAFAAAPIFDGKIQPKAISLSGLFASLQRTQTGQFRLSAGLDPVAPARQAATLPELIGQMDDVLQSPALSALSSVDLRALTLRYEDIAIDKAWTVDGGRLRLVRNGAELAMSADLAVLTGGAGVATLAANYSSQIGATAAKFGVTFDGVDAEDIAAQTPAFAWLDVLRAPISGSVRSGLLPDGRFETLNATLQIGAGALQPNPGTKPIPFDGLRSYFSYIPDQRLLRFDELSVQSAWFTGQMGGTALLGLTEDRRTLTDLVAQITLSDMTANPNDIYETAVDLSGADADFRVQFNPFRLKLGRLQLNDQGQTLLVDGTLRADPEGWQLALDGRMDAIVPARLLALWPQTIVAKTRRWLNVNLLAGDVRNIDIALRRAPGKPPQTYVAFDYADAEVKFLKSMPPIKQGKGHFSLSQNRLVVSLDAGLVTPVVGGPIEVGGSSFILPDITIKDGPPAVIRLETRSSITAALSLLNEKPLNVMDKARLPVTLVDGLAKVQGTLSVPLKRGSGLSKLSYHMAGDLTEVTSDTLVKGRSLRAKKLGVTATNTGVRVGGRGSLDGIPFDGAWTQPIGKGANKSQLRGQATLSENALERFGVRLPKNTVSGAAPARIALDFERGQTPRFAVTSQLRGVTLRVPQLSWSKPAAQAGALEVAGALGATPSIDTLKLDAPGLNAAGNVALKTGGSLDRVRFDRLKVGRWLDAPVDLVGTGSGKPVQVVLRGGALDLRAMGESVSSGGNTTSDAAAGPPMQVRLDRFQITDTIALTNLQGSFDTSGGLDGAFQARLNGATPVEGRVLPQNGRSAVRLTSGDAGGVLRSAGLLKQIEGGQLQLVLSPVGNAGAFDGTLAIGAVRVQNAPGIAGLVNAISVVGLINELNGDGIYFEDVEAKFRLTPNRITLSEASAVGASMGLSMDGVFALDSGQMAMQGVITPIYLLNGIGSVLTRKGEGVFGFNYTLRGDAKAPAVSVNPLSALAPGMFRDILRSTPRQPVTGTRNAAEGPLSISPASPEQKPVARDFEGR